MAETLMRHGADVNAQDNFMYTAVHLAIDSGYTLLVRLLLENGVDLTLKNQKGDLPLHVAIDTKDLAIVQLLVRAGADVNALGYRQSTPLRCAIIHGNLQIICFLIGNGADLSARERQEGIALYDAVYHGHDKVISILVDRGVNVSWRSCGDEETPLHLAAHQGCVDVVKLLVKKGAVIDAVDRDGWTPLHQATNSGHHDTIAFLVESGADISCKTDKGETPLMFLLKHVDAHPEDKDRYECAAHVLLAFGVAVRDDMVKGDNEFKLLKKHYPEYSSWLEEKKSTLKEILRGTVVAHVPTDLQNLLRAFVLTSLPQTVKRAAGVEMGWQRPSKKGKHV